MDETVKLSEREEQIWHQLTTGLAPRLRTNHTPFRLALGLTAGLTLIGAKLRWSLAGGAGFLLTIICFTGLAPHWRTRWGRPPIKQT